ncbi:hypothetical protein ACRAWG_06825 [Methylobacterium sp. P31]
MDCTTLSGLDALPDLQAALDRLGMEHTLRLTLDDCDRLFGINDAVVGQVSNFARGHGCTAIWDASGLLFRRLPPTAGKPAVPPGSEPRE